MNNLIKNGAEKLGVSLSEKQLKQLITYAEILKEWNKKINLTAITDDEGIVTKHFLDSMTAAPHINGRVIDIGCGAGFPGLVLKIVRPDIELTLLDSLNKRIIFLNEVVKALNIDGVNIIHARAEEYGVKKGYREEFDTVVSRAVAKMNVLSEWCIPYIKKNGYFLALKGPLADSELTNSLEVIRLMGGKVEKIIDADIPFTKLRHKIICIKKVRQTPTFFPRNPSLMSKYSAEEYYKKKK